MRIQEFFLCGRSTFELREIAESVSSQYFILYMGVGSVLLRDDAVQCFIDNAKKYRADMVYCDRVDVISPSGRCEEHPVLDICAGSLRDDFDFGPVLFIRAASFRAALRSMENDWLYAGFYDLWLRIGRICRIPMFLYHYDRTGAKPSAAWKSLPIPSPRPCDSLKKKGERQFAYVDPKNRKRQIEFEEVCTAYLKRIGAWLPPVFRECGPECGEKCAGSDAGKTPQGTPAGFPVTASVVIPVFNRVGTIADAVSSAMAQVCDFPFNVIVVDNHSTDGTSEALAELRMDYSFENAHLSGKRNEPEWASECIPTGKDCPEGAYAAPEGADVLKENILTEGQKNGPEGERVPRLEVIVPKEEGHGIGGCWNEAVFSDLCGEFCVQLDSDDVYSGPDTLQRIVDGLREQRCAMLVGSYALTDFDLNMIPPGVIDHREWTEENGRNNALRINGLGAPRAFRTAVLREIGGFPDVSYGEDYAVGLRISREWRIGRIYDVLYLCRRWGGNSDSNLSIQRQNANNAYKDGLREEEVSARMALNDARRGSSAGVGERKEAAPVRFARWWVTDGTGGDSKPGQDGRTE